MLPYKKIPYKNCLFQMLALTNTHSPFTPVSVSLLPWHPDYTDSFPIVWTTCPSSGLQGHPCWPVSQLILHSTATVYLPYGLKATWGQCQRLVFISPVLTQHSARHEGGVQCMWNGCREKLIGNRYLMESECCVNWVSSSVVREYA